MWTLLIISTVIGLDEPKVTRYDDYATALECQQAWYQVTSEFTEGEIAFCEGPKSIKGIQSEMAKKKTA